ncbi:MAG: ABC transporter permease, partial [Burkholderiaceae bacterium]|nr:ABC transporter permease [Burkholderiaceae bacterium]
HAAAGAALGVVLSALIGVAVACAWRKAHGGVWAAMREIAADRTHYPLRAAFLTLLVAGLLCGPVAMLANHYHVLGTDRTGNDVLVQMLKSVRTAFVIGSLATLAMLPLAVAFGVLAGYFKGWVDDVIQYVYTTLASVPSVLLIAASVLMVQVFLDKNPQAFETGAERADLKIFLLCVILGVTGWASLCRLVRAETLKLSELEYVQAALALGVSHARIMGRHILPNVTHLVLITTVLSFSDLILFEAVLTYVGVGVDPSMNSFGGMINMARNEMSRDPVVWWSFAAAFVAMVTLVLAANLFADAVRDAFDPRARSLRPRVLAKA